MIRQVTLLTSEYSEGKVKTTLVKQYNSVHFPIAGDYVMLNDKEYFLVERRVLSPETENVICLGRVVKADDGIMTT